MLPLRPPFFCPASLPLPSLDRFRPPPAASAATSWPTTVLQLASAGPLLRPSETPAAWLLAVLLAAWAKKLWMLPFGGGTARQRARQSIRSAAGSAASKFLHLDVGASRDSVVGRFPVTGCTTLCRQKRAHVLCPNHQ